MNNITIDYLFRLLLRKLVIILLTAALCGASAFSYCNWFAPRTYAAEASILIGNGAFNFGGDDETAEEETEEVNPTDDIASLKGYTTSQNKISGGDIQSSMYLASTCLELLQAQPIYQDLAEEMGYDREDFQSFKNAVTVSLRSDDSIFIVIRVLSSSPDMAMKIANTFAQIAPEYLNGFIPLADVGVADVAHTAVLVSPQTMLMTAIFAVGGAVVSYLLALLLDMNDKTIKGEDDFTSNYSIPLLGSVPDFETHASKTGGYSNAAKQ